MRLLFEEYEYDLQCLQKADSEIIPVFNDLKENGGNGIPCVGYFFCPDIEDSVFILPKVFIFNGGAFGKYAPEDIVNLDDNDNPLRTDGYDKIVFSLSTWLYQAIARYSKRHPHNEIVKDEMIQNVISKKDESSETFLDVILSLLRFNKEHREMFTFVSIIGSCGNNNINWGKTISKVRPIMLNGVPFYAEFRNKDKSLNHDEDIIVLFYSVLGYLRETYRFPIKSDLNYATIKPHEIESMIDSGKGTRLLRSIRRKYYTDELIALWKLLYAFFDKAERIANHHYPEEKLKVDCFNTVFEDMIDVLIGDDIFSDLKNNKDGKRIDHIYKDYSLVNARDHSLEKGSSIYFIGDSKYYKEDTDIAGTSLGKQFTYAKNIIQLNIDIFNDPKRRSSLGDLRYRDDLTEGYNITPNFFIRGDITSDDIKDGKANYTEPNLIQDRKEPPKNIHFKNRLFDRDTLILQTYDINFLFVLASYVSLGYDHVSKESIRERFRNDLIDTFNGKYDFYKVTPLGNINEFVKIHFKEYIGKMYRDSDESEFIWFAFEKGTIDLDKFRSELPDANVETASLTK
ncbi:MAG: LlaJI family restriction endonuclease [Bacteroidales bacterium]|jgi:hypothetical protein|nr:LlaJI family restriction endonuclease [Bacteroidales bacterium]MCI2121247.1 LlaJI family restriction endonuclease [Bacteroidales bacterium]MCI2146157.1 LlaJI family restriction endonuclease [Bacteroidales bacterium]